MNSYMAITPARDEDGLLPGLIASMAAQKCRPARWVIIDDGSADRTAALVDAAACEHSWIHAVHLPRSRPRAEGGESVTEKILCGEEWRAYNYLLRLDADLSFDSDMVCGLLREFALDPQLGIAGPLLLEPKSDVWSPVIQPQFHTRGAAKMYSRDCLLAIGLPDGGLGWDTLDEVRAMVAGFRTRHFPDIHARHHRPQGAAGGTWKARRAAGVAAYRIGYSPIFLIARAMRLALGRSGPVGAIALMAGFFEGYGKHVARPASPEMIAFVRRQQLRRLFRQATLWQ